jgi:hypothetical protein
MEPHPDTVFHRHPMMSSLGSACAIIFGAYTAYSIYLHVEGRDVVRLEDYERKDQISEHYILRDEVQRNYLPISDVNAKYVLRTELDRRSASGGETRSDCVAKKEVEQDYLRKDEVARLWLTKDEVQKGYVSRNELNDRYLPKEEVYRLWVLKTDVPVAKQIPNRTDRPAVVQQPASSSASQDEPDDNDFSVHVSECSSKGAKIVCELTITNEGEERNLMISGRFYPPSSRMFDVQGNEYQPEMLTIGSNQAQGGAQMIVPTGVPVKAQLSFSPVPRDLSSIALLEVQGSSWGPKSNNRRVTFRFKNLSIAKR